MTNKEIIDTFYAIGENEDTQSDFFIDYDSRFNKNIDEELSRFFFEVINDVQIDEQVKIDALTTLSFELSDDCPCEKIISQLKDVIVKNKDDDEELVVNYALQVLERLDLKDSYIAFIQSIILDDEYDHNSQHVALAF